MRADDEDLTEVPPWACILNQKVDVHGFLRYKDTDDKSWAAVKQKEWYRGFPVSYETESPLLFGLCPMCNDFIS